jgi:hypothetical protein
MDKNSTLLTGEDVFSTIVGRASIRYGELWGGEVLRNIAKKCSN